MEFGLGLIISQKREKEINNLSRTMAIVNDFLIEALRLLASE